VDAIKVDLKAHSQDFYADICSTDLRPVLDTIIRVKNSGTWLELVNLIIPTLNDDDKAIKRLCSWVVENVGVDVPVHFTRFYPTYRLKNLPPTPVGSVEKAREIALDSGIRFPYVGNVPAGHPGESTYCPSCGAIVVERVGYSVRSIRIKDGGCAECGTPIPGVWT
jgi:pyruvate formate lyase activating enzyme